MVLTTDANLQGGAAFFSAPIRGSFTANFRYKATGGWQGDGFTMFFYKQQYSNLDSGGSLGFAPLDKEAPGYGVEFDAWQNIAYDFAIAAGGHSNTNADPSNSHIALIKNYAGNHLRWVNDSRVADGGWHQVKVAVQTSSIQVYVDGGKVLEWSGQFDRTYDGFGFSGGTGGCGTNWHLIDDFSITANNLKTPEITTTCTSSKSPSTFEVLISGDLTYNGQGIPDATILFSYSVTDGSSWQDLTTVHTKADGRYQAQWLLSVTGDYKLKAVYKGNENYLGANNIVAFSIDSCSEAQGAFSVTSNSTVSDLTFNSETKELSFNVEGQSGTTGYVEIFIPSSLVSNISGLTVNLDSTKTEYTAIPYDDGWIIYCVYHHSPHAFTVDLGQNANPTATQSAIQTAQPEPTQPQQSLDWMTVAILMAASVFTAVALTVVATKKISKKQK